MKKISLFKLLVILLLITNTVMLSNITESKEEKINLQPIEDNEEQIQLIDSLPKIPNFEDVQQIIINEESL